MGQQCSLTTSKPISWITEEKSVLTILISECRYSLFFIGWSSRTGQAGEEDDGQELQSGSRLRRGLADLGRRGTARVSSDEIIQEGGTLFVRVRV